MNHPSEDQLVLFHYGEAPDRAEIADHLQVCESCRTNYQALQRVCSAVNAVPVPERNESYGAEVWRRVRPQLSRPRQRVGALWLVRELASRIVVFRLPRWAVAGGVALALAAAFVAGRFWQRVDPPSPSLIGNWTTPIPAQARERILLREIGDHA